MSAQIRELFDEHELELVLEAIDHRKRYYESKAKTQAKGVYSRTVKAMDTLEKYEAKVKQLESIMDRWRMEMI